MSEQTEQSYRRRVIRGLVDVIKCGLCEKIGMLELYLHSSFQRAVEVEVESRLRQMKDLAAVRANIDAADIQVNVTSNGTTFDLFVFTNIFFS
jgi:hypothetical protein